MCPPGVDQTMRTRQRWHVLLPRLRQMQPFPSHPQRDGLDPDKMLFNKDQSLNVWSRLAKPTVSNRGLFSGAPHHPVTSCSSVNEGLGQGRLLLETLPSELLSMVISQPELEKADIVAVALASDILRPHVLHHIERECRAASGLWAGSELAATGTHLHDLPAPFIQDDLARKSVSLVRSGLLYNHRSVGRSINWKAVGSYDKVGADAESLWGAAINENANESASMFESSRLASLRDDAAAIFSSTWSSSPGTAWRLRNLTTKEYVNCNPEICPESQVRGCVDHPDAQGLRIDDVLMMHVCWTSKDAFTGPRGLGIYRGAWAGHCFDIVAHDEADEVLLEGWRDVTGEVLEKAARVRTLIKPRPQKAMGSTTPSLVSISRVDI